MKKSLFILGLGLVFMSQMQAKVLDVSYKVGFGMFGQMGIADAHLETKDDSYTINIGMKATGMGTTKIRSFQKSLITVPNHIVANNPIENFSRRGIRRIKMHIGLTYSTNSEQISKIMNDIKEMLKQHEGISQSDSLMVNFDTFGDSSLNIFIYTFTKTANWAKYLEIRDSDKWCIV